MKTNRFHSRNGMDGPTEIRIALEVLCENLFPAQQGWGDEMATAIDTLKHHKQEIVVAVNERARNGIELPAEFLAEYPTNTGLILYRDGSGKAKTWYVGAKRGVDNGGSLRAHLKIHLPSAEFLGWAVK